MISSRLSLGLVAAAVASVVLLAPAELPATNGTYLTGYGAETIGRGGANLAISDRSLALNFNPAGIGQLQGNHFTLNLSVLAPSLIFENAINQPIDSDDRYFPLPAVAYVRGSKDSPWTWGVGFVAQGGQGATFENMNTFFGTRDETFTEIRFMTVTPTLAYNFSDDMALGLALNLGYADASFRFFRDTSFFNPVNPATSFPGVNMKQAAGFQWNVRGGWWWRPHPRFTVGAIYQTETESNFEDGDLWVNYSAFPFIGQHVKYDAEMDGFTFAAQAGVGFALRPDDRWTLALDIKRYFWDDALDTIIVTGRDPELPLPTPFDVVTLPFIFNWEDQWIYAFGADYRLNDRWTLRGGYNFGDNPVPAGTLTPLFPAIVEDHLTFGFSWLSSAGVTYEFAIEHALENSVTNNNPNPRVNPFGPGTTVDHEQWTLSFGVSWAWAR